MLRDDDAGVDNDGGEGEGDEDDGDKDYDGGGTMMTCLACATPLSSLGSHDGAGVCPPQGKGSGQP